MSLRTSGGLADVAARIHASPLKLSIVATGAGASFLSLLTSAPGCSNTLVSAHVPYSLSASQEILGHTPRKAVSAGVSWQLAQSAYGEAVRLTRDGLNGSDTANAPEIIGVGVTAAVQTSRAQRSPSEVFVSSWGGHCVVEYAMPLSQLPSRAEQEMMVCALVAKAVADRANILVENPGGDLCSVREYHIEPHTLVQGLFTGASQCVVYNHRGDVRMAAAPYAAEDLDPQQGLYLLYPGSFKPLHWGHTELARAAERVVQQRHAHRGRAALPAVSTTFELSSAVVDKGAATQAGDLEARAAQFTSRHLRVAVTNAMLFVEKAALFPHHGFVVGVDTAYRVLDPKYYGHSEAAMHESLHRIREHGCYFVVGGRLQGDTWAEFNSSAAGEAFADLFIAIPEEEFRVDISSTELRARKRTMASGGGG